MSGHFITGAVWRAGREARKLAGHLVPASFKTEAREYLHYRKKKTVHFDPSAAHLRTWSRLAPEADVNQPVRLGFAGAGVYAQHHLKVLAALPGVEVSVLHTRGRVRGERAVEKFEIGHLELDAGKFVGTPGLDGFVLVVPPAALHELAGACLQTGAPTLMEKPPGVTSEQTEELIRKAKGANTFGMVGFNRRFYSGIHHGLAALADAGPLRGAIAQIPQAITADRLSGRLSKFEYHHYHVRNSIHAIDLLRFLVGEVEEIAGFTDRRAGTGSAGASSAISLLHEGGQMSVLSELWDTPPSGQMRLVAEQCWLEMAPIESAFLWRPTHGGPLRVPLDPVDINFRMGLYAQAHNFVTALERNGHPDFLLVC